MGAGAAVLMDLEQGGLRAYTWRAEKVVRQERIELSRGVWICNDPPRWRAKPVRLPIPPCRILARFRAGFFLSLDNLAWILYTVSWRFLS